MNLTLLDWLIIGIPFLIIVIITQALRRYNKSVADFLAASRCAGRYLICTAQTAGGGSVMAAITGLEVFSKTGFSLGFWGNFTSIFFLFLGILGVVTYRFRETRALTFHQFFEARYNKAARIEASFLNVFSGLFNFGIQPAIGARFFVYFCGIQEHFTLGSVQIPSFIPIMILLMGLSLYFALTGGQISIMVTDCLENVLSSIFYLIIAGYVLYLISPTEMRQAMTAGDLGKSFVDPFDISGRADFDGWYVIFGLILSLSYFRGNAWGGGFAAAAKSAHEGRMAGILGNWRGYSYGIMSVLISMAAFTMLYHKDFAAQQDQVEKILATVNVEQMKTQMRMPTALGILFCPGIRGAFCSVLLFGLLASQAGQLHGYGTTLLQDAILPFRKKALSPQAHIWWLRGVIFFVAAFACIFSIIYKPVEYLVMIGQLIGSIYLGGIGAVVWGGLYWKRGTSAGAIVSMTLGGILGIACNVLQQVWTPLAATLVKCFGPSIISSYLTAHADKCPFNGLYLSLFVAAVCFTSYIVISLLTCRQPHNMDRLLHRGQYSVEEASTGNVSTKYRSWWEKLLGINDEFSRSDTILTVGTFAWTMGWKVVALGILIWTLTIGHLSRDWWFDYNWIYNVWLGSVLALATTIWFTWGVAKDLRQLFKTLHEVRRNAADDGRVVAGHNADDTDPTPAQTPEKSPAMAK